MKKMKLWMLALPMLLGLASCSNTVDNPVVNPDQPDQPAKEMADYTIIYYGHGGENLDEQIFKNMLQFYEADKTAYENVNIVAQYKFSKPESIRATFEKKYDTSQMDEKERADYATLVKALSDAGNKTIRYVVDLDNPIDNEKTGMPIYGEDNADCSQADSLTNFINYAAKTCPARHYMLVISDHGCGYQPHEEASTSAFTPQPAASTRTILTDDGREDRHFTLHTLTEAIGKADIRPQTIYLDACLMNTAEYQFELAPLTDYLVLSTFIVPGEGGDYASLINNLSENPDDIEQALTNFTKATLAMWDKNNGGQVDENGQEIPVFHDMNVYRTTGIDALGQEIKSFTDKLIEVYQGGNEQVKAAIDSCTANAIRVDESRSLYDLIDYARKIVVVLNTIDPSIYGDPMESTLGKAFDQCIVYQQASEWLEKNDLGIDLSVLLGWNGQYFCTESDILFYFAEDGSLLMVTTLGASTSSWGSTLDAVYSTTRFDKLTGWGRWIKANQQEPNKECKSGFSASPFDIMTDE